MSADLPPLCAVADLGDPGSRGFTLDTPAGALELFLVRKAGSLYAYRNGCPHTGATLEWLPHRFLDADGELIQCGLHGALFRIATGECLRGPCLGDSLETLPIEILDGQIYLALPSILSRSRLS